MNVIFWDFNGTIVDDVQACLDIENEMLAKRGMKGNFTLEHYRNLFCFPVIEYYKKIGYTFEKETYEEVSREFNDAYDERFPSFHLVPCVKELLEESIDKGYTNHIISATRQAALELEVQLMGVEQYFDTLIGIDDDLAFSKVEHAKRFMKDSGLNPEDCLYIGDSLHDLECGLALNIQHIILVACGHQSYEVLKSKWDNVVHTIEEVKI